MSTSYAFGAKPNISSGSQTLDFTKVAGSNKAISHIN